jgi:hypothetical protein
MYLSSSRQSMEPVEPRNCGTGWPAAFERQIQTPAVNLATCDLLQVACLRRPLQEHCHE